MRNWTILVGLLSMVVGAAGCGGGGSSEVEPDAAPPEPDAGEPGIDAFSCAPNEFLGCADPDTARLCDDEGTDVIEESCEFGCGESGGCHACTPSSTECHGDDLVTCDGSGQIDQSIYCELGCDGTEDAACLVLEPSNLPASICEEPTEEDFVVGAAQVQFIDTDSDPRCEVISQSGNQSPEICLIRGGKVEISLGGSIRADGSRALALVATSTLVVDGVIDVSAEGSKSGPGTPLGDLGTGEPGGNGDDTPSANQGGGGGGHGENGGDGASFEQTGGGGGGGAVFNNPELSPLRGGARGGANGAAPADARRAAGGGGGGAIQLVACGNRALASGDEQAPPALIIGENAFIHAGGGGGEGGGGEVAGTSPGGGGGGGSGGAILIEAPSVSVFGVLAANGGGGGGGGARGDGSTAGVDGKPGEDGRASDQPAIGGEGGDGGDGGGGGTGQGGDPGLAGANSGGGGGGAAGRVRINVRSGTSPELDDGLVSPPATAGAVGVR